MKLVALISGGKDSCFNLMTCVNEGHEVVALANLRPPDQDELDSYMFQTVGYHAIELYAEALGIPLIQRVITGASICQDATYCHHDGDEVEDLYQLLLDVKEKYPFEGVTSGAILSNYQRVRVENVCMRLGVASIAYLWQRKQDQLLDEMINAQVEAILIKVAALGLVPRSHLGKSLHEVRNYLHELNAKYDVNICGEGGEYETLTLDCPLFLKRIVVDEVETVIHSNDAFAPVGYLSFKKMHLVDKGVNACLSLKERLRNCRFESQNPPPFRDYELPDSRDHSNFPSLLRDLPSDLGQSLLSPAVVCFTRDSTIAWISGVVGSIDKDGDVEGATRNAMETLKAAVLSNNMKMADVISVHLCCRKMADFARINSVYKLYFLANPPARVCVEGMLPDRCVVQLDACVAAGSSVERQTLHVQSMSFWAPANIGPYSQASKVGSDVFYSGSIGLLPGQMSLVPGGIVSEAQLALHHVARISEVFDRHRLQHLDIGTVTCYVVSPMHLGVVKRIFFDQDQFSAHRYLLICVVVSALPKSGAVEWHFTNHSCEGSVSVQAGNRLCCDLHGRGFFRFSFQSSDVETESSACNFGIGGSDVSGVIVRFIRVFYNVRLFPDASVLVGALVQMFRSPSSVPVVSPVPVLMCEEDAACTGVAMFVTKSKGLLPAQ